MLRSLQQLRFLRENFVRKQYSTAAELASARPFADIPEIPTLPIIRAGWNYLPLIGKYKQTELHLAAIAKYKEYGPILREELNRELSIVHLFEVEDIEQVFRNEGRFPLRRPLFCVKEYRERRQDMFKDVGLFLSDGQAWYNVRSQVHQYMLKPKAVHGYLSIMDDAAKALVRRLEYVRESGGTDEVKDFLGEMYKWALESISLVALDARLGCLELNPSPETTQLIKNVRSFLQQALELEISPIPLWKYFNTPMKKRFYKNMDDFGDLVLKHLNIAKKRLESRSGEDYEPTFLETFLATAKDPKYITTMISDMFLAGVDTTATACGYVIYNLARNQQAQERAYQEVSGALGEHGMSVEALNNLRYLKACVKESMRLTPVALVNIRNVPEDTVLRGYRVPAGSFVMMHSYVTSRDERHFEDPLAYRPERFLKEESKHHPFSFLPFGFGPRTCVGQRIAQQEMWTLLIRVLERFRVEYHNRDFGFISGLVTTPEIPLDLHFIDR